MFPRNKNQSMYWLWTIKKYEKHKYELHQLRNNRNEEQVRKALEQLEAAKQGNGNLLELSIVAARKGYSWKISQHWNRYMEDIKHKYVRFLVFIKALYPMTRWMTSKMKSQLHSKKVDRLDFGSQNGTGWS